MRLQNCNLQSYKTKIPKYEMNINSLQHIVKNN